MLSRDVVAGLRTEAYKQGAEDARRLCAEQVERAVAECESVGYGGFHGGDPREFSPDLECCTAAEIAAHAAACEAVERGEDSCVPAQVIHGADAAEAVASGDFETATFADGKAVTAHRYSFGIGTYTMRDEGAMTALQGVADAIRALDVLRREPKEKGDRDA